MARQSAAERRVQEADQLLEAAGLPMQSLTPRRRRRVCLALLAIANLRPRDSWADAEVFQGDGSHQLTTRQIISFWNEHYDENVSSGSYDDVRRKDLVLLVEAGIALKSAGNPDASTNGSSGLLVAL